MISCQNASSITVPIFYALNSHVRGSIKEVMEGIPK